MAKCLPKACLAMTLFHGQKVGVSSFSPSLQVSYFVERGVPCKFKAEHDSILAPKNPVIFFFELICFRRISNIHFFSGLSSWLSLGWDIFSSFPGGFLAAHVLQKTPRWCELSPSGRTRRMGCRVVVRPKLDGLGLVEQTWQQKWQQNFCSPVHPKIKLTTKTWPLIFLN